MADPDLVGVLVVDKAKGPTSHDIVASLRRVLQLRRIGHCGTLDPLASGVLVICLGRYTRLNRWLSSADKEYDATFRLGATSATGDAQGPIEHHVDIIPPTDAAIRGVLDAFIGTIDQVPPAYSAIKVGGVPSYKRARRGEQVDLKARLIEIHSIDLLHYSFPDLVVRIHCSSGAYIRALAADIGQALGTGAYLAELRRLRVGHLGLDRALSVDEIAALSQADRIDEAFAHPRQALGAMAVIELNAEKLVDFTHGKTVAHQALSGSCKEVCAIFDSAETLFGIARWEHGALRPYCVLRQPHPSAR
ncbi:MAG: tRNA pseudouridine(55) synthase TruB [Candidatus Latescibacterota bacterium]|nr:tRNA pseudouridine(55) synthase TruB [Candidatus Latescibacterota bacterium]